MITETFNLISKLKDVEKCELLITKDDEEIMRSFYPKIKHIISYRLWRKLVIQCSIDTLYDIYDACDILLDPIYKKYTK